MTDEQRVLKFMAEAHKIARRYIGDDATKRQELVGDIVDLLVHSREVKVGKLRDEAP